MEEIEKDTHSKNGCGVEYFRAVVVETENNSRCMFPQLYACVLMLMCVCPYAYLHVSLCICACVLMHMCMCPYAYVHVSSYLNSDALGTKYLVREVVCKPFSLPGSDGGWLLVYMVSLMCRCPYAYVHVSLYICACVLMHMCMCPHT